MEETVNCFACGQPLAECACVASWPENRLRTLALRAEENERPLTTDEVMNLLGYAVMEVRGLLPAEQPEDDRYALTKDDCEYVLLQVDRYFTAQRRGPLGRPGEPGHLNLDLFLHLLGMLISKAGRQVQVTSESASYLALAALKRWDEARRRHAPGVE